MSESLKRESHTHTIVLFTAAPRESPCTPLVVLHYKPARYTQLHNAVGSPCSTSAHRRPLRGARQKHPFLSFYCWLSPYRAKRSRRGTTEWSGAPAARGIRVLYQQVVGTCPGARWGRWTCAYPEWRHALARDGESGTNFGVKRWSISVRDGSDL